MNRHCPIRAAGFTLIEMIAVIAVTGVIAAIIGQLIGGQMAAYLQMSARAGLVQTSQSAMRRIERDVRQSLPASVRVSADGRSVEIISVYDATRYRGSHIASKLVPTPEGAPQPIVNGQTNVAATSNLRVTTDIAHGLNGNSNQLYLGAWTADTVPYWLAARVDNSNLDVRRYDGTASGVAITAATVTANTIQLTVSSHYFPPGYPITVWKPDSNSRFDPNGCVVADDNCFWLVNDNPNPAVCPPATCIELLDPNKNLAAGYLGTVLTGGIIQPFLASGSELRTFSRAPLVSQDADVNTEGGVTADLCSLVSVSQLFDLIGNFTTAIALTPGVSKLVVMNTTATTDSPQNAYQHWLGNDRGNVAEVSAYSRGAAADGSDQITVINGNTLDNTCAFPAASAQQRIYWVNTPVSFSCADGRLVRYSNYFPDPFTVTAVRSGATEGVMADGVEDCAFSLVSPGGTLPPVLTATLTLKSDSGGTAKLIQQIGIENEL